MNSKIEIILQNKFHWHFILNHFIDFFRYIDDYANGNKQNQHG